MVGIDMERVLLFSLAPGRGPLSPAILLHRLSSCLSSCQRFRQAALYFNSFASIHLQRVTAERFFWLNVLHLESWHRWKDKTGMASPNRKQHIVLTNLEPHFTLVLFMLDYNISSGDPGGKVAANEGC